MKEKYTKFLSEEGINNTVEKNESLGPLSGEHLSEITVKHPEDPETMLALAAAILAETSTNKFSGEFVISGRVFEMLEGEGYYLSVVEPLPMPESVKKPETNSYDSFEDAMDSGNGIIDPTHEHRNGKDLL